MKIIPKAHNLLHGGDYNPEQWPRPVWDEDMRLMSEAHVNIATVGVFSWAALEPEEGRFEFGWMDDLLDLLAKNGKLAALATPSAAMPAWMSRRYSEILRTGPDRRRRLHGNRVNFCWTSPIYREKSALIARKLAERYGDHPALAFWHISNEYGGECFCELCEAAFREWLKCRYSHDLSRLNQAYWSKFWSHSYQDWDQIEAPGDPYGETAVLALRLDWKRFTTDQIIDFMNHEAAPIREITPNIPLTTNMMGTYSGIDYWKMAKHVDFISWDSYPGFSEKPVGLHSFVNVAFTHDINRCMKGQPFLLIESTPSSSNWYPVMGLKRPGMHRLEGLQAIAHGSEGVMYFQWRASRGSVEKFHGAVVGHDGGSDTRIFRDVAEVGANLEQIGEVIDSRVESSVAVIFDWENMWAHEVSCGLRQKGKDYFGTCVSHYRPLWEAGVSVDVIDSTVDFSGYRLIIAPMLYMLRPGVAERLTKFVESGGVLVTTYQSGIADENDLCFQGGFPGPFKEVLGLWVESTDALFDDNVVKINSLVENSLGLSGSFEADTYCDIVRPLGCEVLAEVGSEFYAGSPGVTRNAFGKGEAFYLASRNDPTFQSVFTKLLLDRLGIESHLNADLPDGVTVQVRRSADTKYFFILNCTSNPQTVFLKSPAGLTVWNGAPVPQEVELDPYGVTVLKASL